MQLLIVRHAIAEDRGQPGMSDDERTLTPAGKKRFRAAAKGLARILPRPRAILTSPLARARQTAQIAAGAWGRLKPKDEDALIDGRREAVEQALAPYAGDVLVAIVGHEPSVSALLAELLGTSRSERLEFRKGGAALVDLPGTLADGGRLVWYLPPKVLRALGR